MKNDKKKKNLWYLLLLLLVIMLSAFKKVDPLVAELPDELPPEPEFTPVVPVAPMPDIVLDVEELERFTDTPINDIINGGGNIGLIKDNLGVIEFEDPIFYAPIDVIYEPVVEVGNDYVFVPEPSPYVDFSPITTRPVEEGSSNLGSNPILDRWNDRPDIPDNENSLYLYNQLNRVV